MANSIAHFEILGRQPEKLKAFYHEAFGWTIEPGEPPSYGRTDLGNGLTGGIGQNDVPNTPNVTFYISVADLEVTLRKISDVGGETVLQPTNVHGTAKIALFSDPEGNVIGLVERE